MEVDPFASVADVMKDTDDDDAPDRRKLIVSVMVAVAAITIALVAWGSGVISNKSGDESSATIGSAVKAQQADFDSRLKSLEDHAGYLTYRRNNLAAGLALVLFVCAVCVWGWLGLAAFTAGSLIGAWQRVRHINRANDCVLRSRTYKQTLRAWPGRLLSPPRS